MCSILRPTSLKDRKVTLLWSWLKAMSHFTHGISMENYNKPTYYLNHPINVRAVIDEIKEIVKLGYKFDTLVYPSNYESINLNWNIDGPIVFQEVVYSSTEENKNVIDIKDYPLDQLEEIMINIIRKYPFGRYFLIQYTLKQPANKRRKKTNKIEPLDKVNMICQPVGYNPGEFNNVFYYNVYE